MPARPEEEDSWGSERKRQRDVEIEGAIVDVEGGALDAVQGTVPAADHVVAYEVPQRHLHRRGNVQMPLTDPGWLACR